MLSKLTVKTKDGARESILCFVVLIYNFVQISIIKAPLVSSV